MKFEFIKQYYQTILLIIEDRPKYEIPIVFYKALIFISYIQILIYLISPNESKEITDLKFEAVAKISQMISLRNILSIRDSDSSSLVIYLIIQIFMYSYFIYVGVLALVKHYLQGFYENQKKVFISINQILNMYFALFTQIFFTQFVEMNCSIIFCSKRSLFLTTRVSDSFPASQCTVPSWQSIIGGIGLFLTLVTAWIATYFFRNYEFMEYNLIKRKTSNLLSILIVLKFSLTVLYYANLNGEEEIKHILSQTIGIISILDYFINYPYSDLRVAHFYLKVISWYYALVNMTHIWVFSNQIQSYEFFYFALLLGLLVESGFLALNNYRYDQYLLTEVKTNYLPSKLDFYLEELIRLATESAKDELSKVKLQKLIKSHQQGCSFNDCPCKDLDQNQNNYINQSSIKNKAQQNIKDNQSAKTNGSTRLMVIVGTKGKQGQKGKEESDIEERKEGEIEYEQVLSIVDAIFKFFLQQAIVNRDQIEYEHLSLKYITFMIKYLKNYTRANYELKLLQFKREDFSTYFKMIARIISDKIQIVISQMNIHLELRRKDELTVRQIMGVDETTQKYIPQIYKVMIEKQKLWGSLQKGYRNMNHFQNEAIKLMRIVRNVRNQFLSEMNTVQRELKVNQSLQFQKLYLLFYLFVMNDNIRAFELEALVQDLRKRDSLKEIDTLSNENYLRENIITLTISLSQSLGKIVSKKDDKTAQFFGYSKQDFLKIQKINELMPPFLSRTHDNIIKSFVNRGDSQYIKSSKNVYSRDQQGFIMPIKLYLDFSFINENDFLVNGTLLKVNQAFDYILFHRTGKVLGITNRISQYLLCQSISRGTKLPSGDFISTNLHIHLLLPKIAKRIFKRKEQILQSLRSDGDVLLQDRKGQIIVTSNPLMSMKKLQSYVIKMNQSAITKSKVGNASAFDQLDLFSEKSFDLISNYRKQEVDNSSAGGLSSGRLSNGKLSNGRVSNKSQTTKGSQSGRDHQKYKVRFNYSLSFSTISNNYNTEQDLYFQLKMSDVNLIKVKEKQRSYFRVNLLTFLISTSLVNKIDNKFKNPLQGISSIPPNDPSKVSQTLNEWVFTDQDIPTKLLKLVTQNGNQAQQQQAEEQQKTEKKNDKNNNDQDSEDNKNVSHSDSSDDEDENNDYTDDEDNDESLNIDQLRYKKKVLDYYEENAKFEELNKVLEENQISQSDVLKMDPNYKVKKVMQHKSLSSAFGRALEKAIIEALLELQEEKNLLLTSQLEDYNMNDIATFRDFNVANRNPVHPEQIVINPKNIEKQTNQVLYKKQSTNDKSPNFKQRQQDLNVTSNTINDNTYHDISNMPSFHNPYNNHNEFGVDVSSDNLHSYKPELKYFDASARPLFKQQEELNVADNEILITPSVEDNQRQLQESNAATYQNVLSRKEMTKTATLGVSSGQEMNISQGSKYKDNSQTENIKLTSSVNKKQGSNQLLQSLQQQAHNNNVNNGNQAPLTNEEKKQLDPTNIKSDQTKDNDDAIDDQSGKLHEKVVVQLLNQKGLIGVESINKGSIHSSSKSSQSYGGNFLKEIIQKCKIPKHSYQYSFLLIFFIVVFLCLNFTNLMIIQNDMQFFTDNVVVLRQPRKFLRSFGKALLGNIIKYEIEIGILTDTDGSISKTANFYISDGLKEYFTLIGAYQGVLIEYSQLLQAQMDNSTRYVSVFEYQEQQDQQIDFALAFGYNLNFIIGVQSNQTKRQIIDSYLYLRANFFQFSTDILLFGSFLVQNVLDTVDNLILKFTIIAICAIMGVIIVALVSLPILRLINLYEEKILMIVSRINYDHSQIEKLKLGICQQLIDIDQYDWLKYNFNDVVCLRFDQFDVNVVNSQHDLQKISSSKKGVEKINASNILKLQQELASSNLKASNQFKQTKLLGMGTALGQHVKNLKKPQKKIYNDSNSSYKDYQINMKNNINKNYVLQSKIINQKLSVFQRFIPLFILTICNTIYFLVIIVYLQESKDLLKIPVQFNRRTIQNHIAHTTLKISAELLTFNFLIEERKLLKTKTSDLDKYSKKMDEMIQLIIDNTQQNTDLVYGNNPYPADILDKFKDFEQGDICQYLVKFKCTQEQVGSQYSVNYILQEKLRVIKAYPQVITADDAPLDLLISFSNSQDHIKTFVNSFLIEDEVVDLYSSSANLSIGTISSQVQTFLEQYLQIFGNMFGLSIIIVCLFAWRSLYQRMQLMNLLLTFIPEEKLLEEVTLQMLKSLRRM